MQQQYFEAFAGEKAAEFKIKGLEGTVKSQAWRIAQLESPFHTPVRSSSAPSPQGEAPQLATMPFFF